jgi:hypothetical protein
MVESNGSTIVSKKIVPGIVLNHPTIGYCIKYLCTRDGYAEITKELNPKEAKLCTHSKLNNGDKIQANAFYVLVKSLRRKSIDFGGKMSGAHNCNSFSTNTEFTYAEISIPFSCGENITIKLEAIGKEIYVSPISELTKKKTQQGLE